MKAGFGVVCGSAALTMTPPNSPTATSRESAVGITVGMDVGLVVNVSAR